VTSFSPTWLGVFAHCADCNRTYSIPNQKLADVCAAWARQFFVWAGRFAQLAAGLESALANLGIKDRNDPTTTLLAKLIIQLAKDGERDPTRLAERAIGIVRGSS
jgi:hypothetical protein